MSEQEAWAGAEDLTFRYGANVIFENLSFRITADLVALQGPSGSGKTTLLKLLNGDLEPSGGQVAIEERSIIMILQDDSLLPWLSGAENLAVSTSFDAGRIYNPAILESMADFVGKRAHEMSFGQRRYVEIVRALGSESDVLLLDEPLNFLDVGRRAAVIRELLAQSAERRIMMSTHYIEDFDGAPVGRLQLVGPAPFCEVVIA